jgi:hypothetical protein
MTAIDNDAASELMDIQPTHDEQGAAEAFLKRFLPPDAEKPSGSEGDKAANAADDSADTETDDTADDSAEKPEGDAETEETDADKDRKFADDSVFVKVKVGDEEHQVSVKDLGRLFGQEKALTQKSMEVAETRKAVDAELQKNATVTQELLARARQKFEPFAKIDFLLASKELSAEDYTNLRTAAAAAYEDVQFLENGLNNYVKEIQTKQNTALVEQAKEAIKVLSGPTEKGGIEGWDEKTYDGLRSFAVSAGLDKQIVNQLVDPVAIKLIHDAMLFRRGQSKVVTTKVNKTPTKVVKTTTSPASAKEAHGNSAVKKALSNLKKTGTTDDAADAFMARWKDNDDNNE